MNLEGSVIGNRYKIIEKIGNGGMATVYKALDQVLNRYVAIKILRDEFTTDEEFIKRFNAEAQSAARLTHPNIVSVFDVGQEYNIYYIVMELIQGKTLKQIIEEDGYLSWKWSINIAVQIASALEMAHKNNIIHRDIKPHNIMITEDGVAKVTDFGIAKAVSNSTITAFGTTLGSVHYFSPEHARGGYTDSKSDLYSLGVVMYEMITGKVPFDADTPVSVALKHMQENPEEPIKINKDIPFAVNQIVMKAMRKEPSERYQNASEMIKDLNLALKRPQGGFIEDKAVEQNYTKRIPTIGVEEDYRANSIKQVKDNEFNNSNNVKEKGKVGQFFKQHPAVKVLSIIAGLALIFVSVILITINMFNKPDGNDVQIPSVVGKSQEEAKQIIERANLKYNVIREEYNKDVQSGYIVSQSPVYIENYSVKVGSTVGVVVSKGIKLEKMIKVIGMEYSEAEMELRKLGFVVEKVEEVSQKIEEGYVINQEILEGVDTEVGSTIKVHVSIGNGLKKITLPKVIDKTLNDAKRELTDLGLEVNIVEAEDTSKSEDIILKQSIEPNTIVEEGAVIELTVNKYKPNQKCVVNVNVKKYADKHFPIETITTPSKTEDSKNTTTKNETKESNVYITIKVGGDIVCNQKVSRTSEKFSYTVEGKGSKEVSVYINDEAKVEGIKISSKTIDFNGSNLVYNVN